MQARTHGHGRKGNNSPTYSSWRSMKQRCLNTNDKNYAQYKDFFYGPWIAFEQFLADMGERPEGTTLDRIDNTKGYSPENCRWATASQQARNKKNVVLDDETAQSIRRLYFEQGLKSGEVQKQLGVSKATVSNVVRGKTWNNYGL